MKTWYILLLGVWAILVDSTQTVTDEARPPRRDKRLACPSKVSVHVGTSRSGIKGQASRLSLRGGDDLPKDSPKETVAVLRGHTRAIAALTFSPKGDLLASTGWDNSIRLWRFDKGASLWVKLDGSPSGVAFSPDGKTVAAGVSGTSVHLWDVTRDPPKVRETLPGHKHRPFAIAFAPNGKLLVTGCNEPVLRLWKVGEGEPEAWGVLANEAVPSLGIASLAVSKDSKLLVAGSLAGERSLRLWNVGDFLEEIDLPKTRARLVAFSPVSNVLAFAGDDAGITLWDVAEGKPKSLRKLAGHATKMTPAVVALTFAPDGKHLASSGKDGKVFLWETFSGKKLQEWFITEEIRALAFAPDGRRLVLGAADGLIYVLRLKE